MTDKDANKDPVKHMEAQMDKCAAQFVAVMDEMTDATVDERIEAVSNIFKCMAMSSNILGMAQLRDVIKSEQKTAIPVASSILDAALKAGKARWN